MAYPSTVSTFPMPSPTDRLNSPSHSDLHNQQSSAISQIERFVGTTSSAVGTLMYDIRSSDSNGGGHVQTANRGGTGQTSYAKGDLLVARSSSVLSKLTVGTDGQGLRADSSSPTGISWGSTNSRPTVNVYTNASVFTYTKPSFLSYLRIRVQGAGKSGDGTTNPDTGCVGGDGGGYAEGIIPASLVSATTRVQIGGSILGTTGAGASNYTGFGTFVSILGATPSVYASDMLTVPGAAGNLGFYYNNTATGGDDYAMGGRGGDSQMGFGAGNVFATEGTGQNGLPGRQYGGGGGGGAVDGTTDVSGGTGAQGIIIIEEY